MTDQADIDDAREQAALGEPPDLGRMDARILAAYRREFGSGRSAWRRRLRVPVPVAALVIAALLVTAAVALRALSGGGRPLAPASEPAQTAGRDLALVTTQTSLVGFQPVDDDEMQVVVVGRRRP